MKSPSICRRVVNRSTKEEDSDCPRAGREERRALLTVVRVAGANIGALTNNGRICAKGALYKLVAMATLQLVCCRPALRIVGLSSELVSTSSSSSSLGSGLVCRKSVRGFHLGRAHENSVGRRRRGALAIRARSGGEKPGDSESKQVLDAFFLGKALAETINERLGTAIGEFLSDVGRQQAEQQKKIREFQDEVQEKAKAAAAKAARKALAAETSKPAASTSAPSQPPPSTASLSDPSDAPTTSAATPPPPPPPMAEDGIITIDD